MARPILGDDPFNPPPAPSPGREARVKRNGPSKLAADEAGPSKKEKKTHTAVQTRHRTYTVVSGDTLAGIAAKTGTTVAKLEQLNPGIDPTALRVGQTIRVMPAEARLLIAEGSAEPLDQQATTRDYAPMIGQPTAAQLR